MRVSSYLIDLVAGASLSVTVFYFFLNEDPYIRDWNLSRSATANANGGRLSNNNGNSFSFPNGSNGDPEQGYKAPTAEDYELPLREGAEDDDEESQSGISVDQDHRGSSALQKAKESRPRTPRLGSK